MKTVFKIMILALTMCMLFQSAVFAEETKETEIPCVTAYKAKTPIVVDGDLSEWNLSSPIVIENDTQVIRDDNFWKGSNDASAKVYVMWDETNLYLAVDMVEDTPFQNIEGLPLDYVDNFMVFLSTNPKLDPERTKYDTNDFLLYLIVDNNYWDTAFDRSMVEARERFSSAGMEGGEDVLTGYEKSLNKTTLGYVYEAIIPWENFSNNRIEVYTPEIDDTIKFNFVLTDTSMACPGTEYVPQMAWTGNQMIKINPSLWGNLVFAGDDWEVGETAATTSEGNSVEAWKAPSDMKLDGDISKYNTDTAVVLNDYNQLVRDANQWEGIEDLSGKIYFMWDEDKLYLLAEMTDDTPFMYREGFPPDMADSLVLFFSTNPEADPGREQYEATDFRVTVLIDDYYFTSCIDRDMIEDPMGIETMGEYGDEEVLEGYEYFIIETESGYIFEAVIPFANFANDQIALFVPEDGMTIGFDIGMFDLDFPCPGVATVRIQWTGNVDSDVNPGLWGTLTFRQ